MFIQGLFEISFYILFLPEIMLVYFLLVLLVAAFLKHNICSSVLNRLLFWLVFEIGVFEIIFLLYVGWVTKEVSLPFMSFDVSQKSSGENSFFCNGGYWLLTIPDYCVPIRRIWATYGMINLKIGVVTLVLLCSACFFLYFCFEKFFFCEYYLLMLFFLLGAFFIVSAVDLFLMYIAIEFLSLCIYLMVIGGGKVACAFGGGI